MEIADLFETESKPTVYGFVKIGEEVIEVASVSDLEKATKKAKAL